MTVAEEPENKPQGKNPDPASACVLALGLPLVKASHVTAQSVGKPGTSFLAQAWLPGGPCAQPTLQEAAL